MPNLLRFMDHQTTRLAPTAAQIPLSEVEHHEHILSCRLEDDEGRSGPDYSRMPRCE